MAVYMHNNALNIAADAVTNRTISIRIHDGAPGNSGTNNRIGSHEEDVAASGWTTAANGRSENSAAVSFGVLSSSDSHTVEAVTFWDGSTFLGWADLASNVTVAANETFTLQANTVDIVFARP